MLVFGLKNYMNIGLILQSLVGFQIGGVRASVYLFSL